MQVYLSIYLFVKLHASYFFEYFEYLGPFKFIGPAFKNKKISSILIKKKYSYI